MANSAANLPYKRVLLKITGEALMGDTEYGINIAACQVLAEEIRKGMETGVQLCLVIGGGNIFRGMKASAQGMERPQADSLGMLATVMNALAMQSVLEKMGIATRVQSAINMPQICEPYIRRRAVRHLEKNRLVIFAAGTGHPFFTTDTGAALRAAEMGCDAMFKGTKVDGVYTSDPAVNKDAERLDRLRYMDVLARELNVMDSTAISLMKDNHIPIRVFDINKTDELSEVLQGRGVSTLIDDDSNE